MDPERKICKTCGQSITDITYRKYKGECAVCVKRKQNIQNRRIRISFQVLFVIAILLLGVNVLGRYRNAQIIERDFLPKFQEYISILNVAEEKRFNKIKKIMEEDEEKERKLYKLYGTNRTNENMGLLGDPHFTTIQDFNFQYIMKKYKFKVGKCFPIFIHYYENKPFLSDIQNIKKTYSKLPRKLRAKKPADVETIIFIEVTHSTLGQYQGTSIYATNEKAYITYLDLNSKQIVAKQEVQSNKKISKKISVSESGNHSGNTRANVSKKQIVSNIKRFYNNN